MAVGFIAASSGSPITWRVLEFSEAQSATKSLAASSSWSASEGRSRSSGSPLRNSGDRLVAQTSIPSARAAAASSLPTAP